MCAKDKPIIQEKSSEKVAKFLDKNGLHKKDLLPFPALPALSAASNTHAR